MAKFKPARKKSKSAPAPPGGLPCVILLISAVVLFLLFLYLFLRWNANG